MTNQYLPVSASQTTSDVTKIMATSRPLRRK